MSENRIDIELIDDFLDGKLTGEDLFSFNKRKDEDEDFKVLFNEISLIRAATIAKSREDLLIKLKNVERDLEIDFDHKKISKIPIYFLKHWQRYAAIIVIVAASAFILFQLLSVSDKSQIIDKYLVQYAELKAPNSRGYDSDQIAIEEALESFMDGKYKRTIEQLKKVDPDNNFAALLNGISYLHIDKYDEAIPYLFTVAQSDEKFSDSGKFYLALGLYGIGEDNQAVYWLKLISTDSVLPVQEVLKDFE